MAALASISMSQNHFKCLLLSPTNNYSELIPFGVFKSIGKYSLSRVQETLNRDKTGFSTLRKREVRSSLLDLDFWYKNGQGSLLPGLPPEPVEFPRKPLDLKFAVLLMRSSYEAVDDLDFIPMDQFQAQFWKLRQSEVEPYTLQYRPLRIKYGDLTDPLYFDFISFAQYATISEAMRSGKLVFQERLGVDGVVHTVRRNDRLRNNADLPPAFKAAVGAKIFDLLSRGFEEQLFGGPQPLSLNTSVPDVQSVLQGVKQLLAVFTTNGYALKANVSEAKKVVSGGYSFSVKVEGPATLWGVRALASRRASALPDFDAMAIRAFLFQSGFLPEYRLRCTDTFFEHEWTIS